MKPIPTPRRLLLPLALGVSLNACAHDPLTPDADRFTPAPMPVEPAGEAVCNGAPCLSQAQAALLFNETIDAALTRGDQLCWLADYFAVKVEGC